MVDISTRQNPMRKSTKAREFIDPYEFYLARKRAGLTVKAAADMLHVTERTVRNWENKTSQIPYAAFRLMRIQAGHVVNSSGWEGWTMNRGVLYSPIGRSFEPYTLTYLGNYLWMARQWLKEKRLANAAKTLTPNPKSPLSPRRQDTGELALCPNPLPLLKKAPEVEQPERDGKLCEDLMADKNQPIGRASDVSGVHTLAHAKNTPDVQPLQSIWGRVNSPHTPKFAKFGNVSEFGRIGAAANDMIMWEEQ